jgi:N-acetyl-gamma-glutamyl-phosphate reductase
MHRVGIVGATGYTGSELIRLLSGHPQARITALVSRSEAGKPIETLLSHMNGLSLPTLSAFDPDALAAQCDLVFLAGETGFAMEHAPALLERGLKVIDLSADFRLKDPAQFADWYGKAHTASEWLAEAVYGLPELTPTDAYKNARLIANPGCYPTAAGLALAPLLQMGVAEPDGIIIDAKSGVSGAGRSRVSVEYLFTELDENFKAYGVEKHRHTPEIEQTLQAFSERPVRVRFTPALGADDARHPLHGLCPPAQAGLRGNSARSLRCVLSRPTVRGRAPAGRVSRHARGLRLQPLRHRADRRYAHTDCRRD